MRPCSCQKPFLRLLLGTFLTCAGTAAAGVAEGSTAWLPWVHVDMYASSESVSLAAALDEWNGPLRCGNTEETDNRIELGVASESRRWSLFYRYMVALRYSDDTARLYHATENGLPMSPGDELSLSLAARRFALTGLRFRQRIWATPHGELDIALSGFAATRLLDGRIGGNATVLTPDSYSYLVHVDYRYHSDVLLHRSVEAPRGIGAALGMDLRYALREDLEARLRLDDVLAYLRWQHVPATTVTANSSRTSVDGNGHIVLNPLLTGREYELPSFSQKIPVTGSASLQARLGPRTRAGIGYDQYAESALYSLTATRCYGAWCVGVAAFPQAGGWGLTLTHDRLAFSVQGDKPADLDGHWQRLTLTAEAATSPE